MPGLFGWRAVAIAAVIVTVVLLVYVLAARPTWGHVEYWKLRLFETPEAVYGRSSGGFDEAAQIALQRSEIAASRPGARPRDHDLAATIIRRNILQQRGERPDPQVSLARIAMHARARDHYAAALVALNDQALARALSGEADSDPAGPMLDRVVDFAFTGAADLTLNDPLLTDGALGEPALTQLEEQVRAVGRFDAPLARAAERLRSSEVRQRQAAAAAAAPTPASRTKAFVGLAQQNTSDSQNSHDPSVNAAKRGAVDRLRADQGALDRLPSIDQITSELAAAGTILSRDPRTQRPRPKLVEKALGALARTKNGEHSVSAGATDEEVARRVWARAEDPRNAASRPALRQSYFDALVDCWERGVGADVLQCVDGRISRLVGSLVLLDCDERNWNVRRLEQHKNDIFAEAQRVIRQAAEEASRSSDSATAAVGRAYLAESKAELDAVGDLDPAAEEVWKSSTRAAIAAMVDKYVERAAGAVPPHAVRGIKTEAVAAVI